MSRQINNNSDSISITSLEGLPALISSSLLDRVFSVANGFWAKKRVEGYGPKFIKTGSRVLYPKEEVITWINKNTVSSTSSSISNSGSVKDGYPQD